MLNEQDNSGGEDEPDGMMSSLAKSKGARNGFVLFLFLLCIVGAWCAACTWCAHGEKCQSFRGKLAYVTIERVSTKKKKWRRPTHGFLHLKSLVRQADERSCKLMSFRLGFSSEISPSYFMTKNSQTRTHRLFFPSELKQLSSDTVKGCSSSS